MLGKIICKRTTLPCLGPGSTWAVSMQTRHLAHGRDEQGVHACHGQQKTRSGIPGIDSLSILFNHGAFHKPDIFPTWVFEGFLKRFGSQRMGKVPLEEWIEQCNLNGFSTFRTLSGWFPKLDPIYKPVKGTRQTPLACLPQSEHEKTRTKEDTKQVPNLFCATV